jgi:predicted acylesterase/phospholipase RssA
LRVAKNFPCTIVEAASATSAAPFYFPAKKIRNRTFWDGGLQNNNPICQVIAENGPEIPTVVISIGTGRMAADIDLELQDAKEPCFSWPIITQLGAVLEFVTNAENEHHSFARVLKNHKIPYFRLNPVIEETVSLSNYRKMAYLKIETKKYLATREVKDDLMSIARLLFRKLEPLDPLGVDDDKHPQRSELQAAALAGTAIGPSGAGRV